MTNLYTTVEFLELQQLAVVPSDWLSAEEDECFWPPSGSKEFKRVSSLIKELAHKRDNWDVFNIRILGKASKRFC